MLKCFLLFACGAFCGFWLSGVTLERFYFWKADEEDAEAYDDEELHEEHINARMFHTEEDILCVVRTSPEHKDRVFHIKETWGMRCDHILFTSTEEDPTIPTVAMEINEGVDAVWGNTKEAIMYVYEHYMRPKKWALFVDDETYVVVENLRIFLSGFNCSEELVIGRYTKSTGSSVDSNPETEGYLDDRAGFVLSSQAVKRFVEGGVFLKPICNLKGTGENDVGKCAALLGVRMVDSRDGSGRGRFFPMKPTQHIRLQLETDMWHNGSFSHEQSDCCSNSAITFHQVSSVEMYTLEYFLYHLHPYGIKHLVDAKANELPRPVSDYSLFLDDLKFN